MSFSPNTHTAPPMRDGSTFDLERDGKRLERQHDRVRDLMLDGYWRTLSEIARHTGAPEASVSARLRDLRKPRFGGYVVERKNLGGGTWKYRLVFGQLELLND